MAAEEATLLTAEDDAFLAAGEEDAFAADDDFADEDTAGTDEAEDGASDDCVLPCSLPRSQVK